MKLSAPRLTAHFSALATVLLLLSIPTTFAQSSQASAEWVLFNQIMIIGIIVGIIVFGLLFYAVIRFREKPQKPGAQ